MNSTNFKLNKLHYFLLYLFLSLWLFARNGSGDDEIGPFKYTHYLFNYEYEFLKRGFVGEILSLFFNPLQYEVVNFISLIFLIILSIVFFNIFVSSFNKRPDASKLIFSIMVFTSPVTMQHFIYDSGRFDIINLIIVFLCFFIVEKFYKKTLLIFFLTGSLMSIMILIHEAAFFMFVPVIFGYWFFKNSYKSSIIAQIILFSLITFITFKISTIGVATKFTPVEYYKLLHGKEIYFFDVLVKNPYVSKFSINVLYGGLFQNFDDGIFSPLFGDAILVGLSKFWLIHNFILILCLSPLFYLVFIIFKELFYKSKIQTKILLISCLSPFCLFLFAYDHMRWWSLMFTNIFIIFFIISKENNFYSEILKKNIKKYKKLIIFLIISGFILGPVGNYHSFGIFVKFLGPTIIGEKGKTKIRFN
tara:strand:+ start:1484 stop:2737 length:1254 start_codon:yes stop_codon:yes gene_type:complete